MENKGLRSRIMRKYRLTIHNENKLENVMGFYISPFWVIISLFFSFVNPNFILILRQFIFLSRGAFLKNQLKRLRIYAMI